MTAYILNVSVSLKMREYYIDNTHTCEIPFSLLMSALIRHNGVVDISSIFLNLFGFSKTMEYFARIS